MEIYKKFKNSIYFELAIITIIFLFFFQLISDFVEVVYTQNLLTTSLNESVLAVLFFISPVFLLFLRKEKNFLDKAMVISGEVMIICRVLEPMLVLESKMIILGIGVGCFLIFFPIFLIRNDKTKEEQIGLTLGLGLAIALALSILFRTLGSTIDISTYSWFQGIGWILALLAAIFMLDLPKKKQREINNEDLIKNNTPSSTNSINTKSSDSKWKILGLTFSLTSILLLTYLVFSSPTVISRWTEGDYIAIIVILIIIISLFSIGVIFKPDIINEMKHWIILLWNGLFVLSLVLTVVVHQVMFPSSAGGYPLIIPATTIIQQIPLFLMLILSPIILMDFTLVSRELIKSQPSIKNLGGSFTLAIFFFLLMIFAEIFTITYDYIPVIGPLFRDVYWIIFLIIGITVALPVLLVTKSSLTFKKPLNAFKSNIRIVAILGLISVATILGGIITAPYPSEQTGIKTSTTILTYNIYVGKNRIGIKNIDGQLEVLKEMDADIIGLQESDTARISGGLSDAVRFFANGLNLYSYYGPKTVIGTFGIALLSKYPIKNAKTFYMYSTGEQTACIEAQIAIKTKTYNIFVTHLGNTGDPSQFAQISEILARVEGKSNVILMGDFNFERFSEHYNLTTEVLDDSWLLKWPTGRDDKGNYPISAGIGKIFVSPGTGVIDSEYFSGMHSDTPALKAEITL